MTTKRDRMARARGYRDFLDAVWQLRLQRWSQERIAEYLDLTSVTVCSNMPKELKGHCNSKRIVYPNKEDA